MRPLRRVLRKLFIGALVVSTAKVLISYFRRRRDYTISNIDMEEIVKTGNVSGTEKSHDYYMACWMSSLAQRHLKFVRVDDAYAKYSSGIDSFFYLFRTSIHDKDSFHAIGSEEHGENIVFDVRIDRIAYSDTKYNRFVFGIKDFFTLLHSKLFYKPRPEKEVVVMSDGEYHKLYDRIQPGSKKSFGFSPSLKMIAAPLELRLELIDSLPCGMCQFRITTEGDDYDFINEVKKYIFDQIHSFFHHHHYCHHGMQENMPLLSDMPMDIVTPDNDCVKYFIGNITDALVNRLDDIYKSYRILLVTNKIKREKGQKRIGKKKLVRSSWEFFNDCDNLLGIHAFLTTLLNSPRNNIISVVSGNLSDENKGHRETAMLIESAYKGTIALMQKISHHEDFRKQRKSMRAAVWGIWASAIFSLAGIVVSICLSEKACDWVGEKWDCLMAAFGLM